MGDACATEEELYGATINFAISTSHPNILSENKMEPILYGQSIDTFFYLEPDIEKVENIFFMESSINLEDNKWDLFDVEERDVNLFENQKAMQV